MFQNEADIIRRIQAGERELFGELHRHYYPRVQRFIELEVFHREEAQDLALEVFLRAYQTIDRFRPRGPGAFCSYLLRIASNLVTDYRRRLPATDTVSWEGLAEDPPLVLVSPTPEEEWQQREQRAQVQRALAELPPEDRQILYLAYEEDLSRQQIAEVMGKPSVTAVTSHLYRALQKVRDRLARAGEDVEGTSGIRKIQR